MVKTLERGCIKAGQGKGKKLYSTLEKALLEKNCTYEETMASVDTDKNIEKSQTYN